MKRVTLAALGLAAAGCADGLPTDTPARPGEPGAKRGFAILDPGGVAVARGRAADVTLRIARENFTGPVVIAVTDLPGGVSLATRGTTIRAGRDSLTVILKV